MNAQADTDLIRHRADDRKKVLKIFAESALGQIGVGAQKIAYLLQVKASVPARQPLENCLLQLVDLGG